MHLSAPSPAVDFINRNAFLTQPDGSRPAPVLRMEAVDADTVALVVTDPWAEPGDDAAAMAETYADTAATVLEQAVDGVKLVVRTEEGYVGREGYFSGDEQYFANTLPGLTSQAAEVGWDMDGDGVAADDETAFLFPVASQADVDRLDPLIRPQISDYPVVFAPEG